MGGGFSLPRWLVREIVDPYPADPGQRIDTLSIARSQACKDCRLGVPTNLSTSSVTLKRVTAGDFAPTNKVFIEPSLPFKVSWNGKETEIRQMTLYHPFPIRIENVQYDAVLSLNDPSIQGVDTVVLIPLVAGSAASPSSAFLDRIGPQIARVLAVNPETKAYETATAATGADWLLTNMLPLNGTRVQSGYYQWFAGRGYESYKDTRNPFVHFVRWRAKEPRINYITLETPATISPAVLSAILTLPRTDALSAISPISPIVTYKPCANTPAPTRPVREGFRPTPDCDPFQYRDTSGERKKVVLGIVGAIVTLAVIMIGTYIGLLAAGGQLSIQTKQLGDTAGEFIYKQIAAAKAAKAALTGGITGMIAKKAGLPIGLQGGLPASLPSGLLR
jgi:hypothetical protein